jgi:hypothetical protein
MTKALKVSSTRLFWRTILFLLILTVSILSAYFLIYDEEFIYMIVIGFSCFFIPWSYFELVEVSELKRRQFQKLVIEEDHLLFEHLPKYGGVKLTLPVDYSNIKNITINKSCLSVQVVRRQNWKGLTQDFFMPIGPVPKSQRFSLPTNHVQRAEILNFFSTKGIRIDHKPTRFF